MAEISAQERNSKIDGSFLADWIEELWHCLALTAALWPGRRYQLQLGRNPKCEHGANSVLLPMLLVGSALAESDRAKGYLFR